MNALTDTWPRVTNHTSDRAHLCSVYSLAMDFAVLKTGHTIQPQISSWTTTGFSPAYYSNAPPVLDYPDMSGWKLEVQEFISNLIRCRCFRDSSICQKGLVCNWGNDWFSCLSGFSLLPRLLGPSVSAPACCCRGFLFFIVISKLINALVFAAISKT